MSATLRKIGNLMRRFIRCWLSQLRGVLPNFCPCRWL